MGLRDFLKGRERREKTSLDESVQAAPMAHEFYRKGLELYRSSGATAEVVHLMQKAGEGGDGRAWAFLGYLHQEGEGVSVNPKTASECHKRAVDLKCGIGIYDLGVCYVNGIGVTRDMKMAFECFQKSADIGCDQGLNAVGDWYYNGVFVRRDYGKAVKNFKAAFALGCEESAFRLAFCIEHGQGVGADLGRAIALYRIAARMGYSRAQDRAMALSIYHRTSQDFVDEILNGNQRLFAASVAEDANKIRILVRCCGVDIDSSLNPDGDTLLTRSIRTGNMDLAQMVIDMGADVNIPLRNGRTALMTAAGIGDVGMVQTLIAAGAKIDWRKSGGNTALMYAVSKHQKTAAQALLDAGADWRMKDDEGMDAKGYACSFAPELSSLFS